MTINKSQRQILEQIGLYLHDHIFSNGQLYVALSKVTFYKGIKILIDKKMHMMVVNRKIYTKNIVYSEIFYDVALHY